MWGQAKPMLINDKWRKPMEAQSESEGSGGLNPLFFHHRRRIRSRSRRAKVVRISPIRVSQAAGVGIPAVVANRFVAASRMRATSHFRACELDPWHDLT